MGRRVPVTASLAKAAKDNPNRLFNASELAQILCVSEEFMTDLRDAGAPFPGNVSRPEWLTEWMREKGNEFTRRK